MAIQLYANFETFKLCNLTRYSSKIYFKSHPGTYLKVPSNILVNTGCCEVQLRERTKWPRLRNYRKNTATAAWNRPVLLQWRLNLKSAPITIIFKLWPIQLYWGWDFWSRGGCFCPWRCSCCQTRTTVISIPYLIWKLIISDSHNAWQQFFKYLIIYTIANPLIIMWQLLYLMYR